MGGGGGGEGLQGLVETLKLIPGLADFDGGTQCCAHQESVYTHASIGTLISQNSGRIRTLSFESKHAQAGSVCGMRHGSEWRTASVMASWILPMAVDVPVPMTTQRARPAVTTVPYSRHHSISLQCPPPTSSRRTLSVLWTRTRPGTPASELAHT